MKSGRLHLRLDPQVVAAMKAYAKRRRLTMNALVETYFLSVLAEESRMKDADQV